MKNRSILILVFSAFCFSLSAQVDYDSLGTFFLKKDMDDTALVLLTKAISLNQHLSDSYQKRGFVKAEIGDFSGAKLDLDLSHKMDPLNYEIYVCYGKLYSYLQEYEKSICYFDTAISLGPKHADGYDGRALAKSYIGLTYPALKDENLAIQLDSTNGIYFNNRGWFYYQLTQYQKAIMDYNIAIKLNPSISRFFLNRAKAYESWSKYPEAILDCSQAITLSPEDPNPYCLRGMCYLYNNENDKACSDFAKAAAMKSTLGIQLQKDSCKQ
jgi:tetratricopeptide (TPR) repeat protein